MASDALLAVADDALRQVLEYALEADGWRVQTASDEATAGRKLSSRRPSLLLLDGMMPMDDGAAAWAERHAPGVPLVLLVSAWEPLPELPRDDAVVLPMPFGRADLQRAVTAVCRCTASRSA
jgi:DNA-binding response OmpR family regulator